MLVEPCLRRQGLRWQVFPSVEIDLELSFISKGQPNSHLANLLVQGEQELFLDVCPKVSLNVSWIWLALSQQAFEVFFCFLCCWRCCFVNVVGVVNFSWFWLALPHQAFERFFYASCVVDVVALLPLSTFHAFAWRCPIRLLRFSYASYVVVHVRSPQALQSVQRV